MRRLTVLVLALLLSVPLASLGQPIAGDDALRFEPTPQLTVFRSRHYLIHTNLTRDQTQPFGRHMDAVFDQYDRRFSGFIPREFEAMPLYLLRTREQYMRFMAERGIDASNSGGMFFVTHGDAGLATWADSDNRRKTYQVLQHEGFHQFAWHVIGPGLPVWLNEGLAQYFEDAVLADGRMTVGMTSRARIQRVRDAVQSSEVLPLSELMFISNAQWSDALRDDPEKSALLYAQSWSVAYYLVHGESGRRQRQLIDYLKLLNQGNRSDEAMLLAFGPDALRDLTNGWRDHALTQRPDDIATATERLEFLGTGLRLLEAQGEDMPESLDELRDTLRRYGFKLRRRELGVTRHLSADRDDLFRFPRGSGGESDFVLLAPSHAGLPPRISAPGLEPEPTLIWYRDANGELVQDIEYR